MSTQTTAVRAESTKPAGDGSLTHRQIMVVLSGLMLGMFLAALDNMIVASSIRKIADDLHGLDQMAWATTAYLITATVSTPLYGKLSDMFGRKPFFLFAISIFLAGSIACTTSTSMYMLAAFRAVQGIGAGGLMSLAFAILGDIVPPRERARYTGYFMAVFGTSTVAGPLLGGLLAGQDKILGITGWRWVFLVNVPIGAIALFVVWKVLNLPHSRKVRHRLDWPGALALIIGLVPLLIVAEQGRDWGWGSTRSVLCFIIGAVGLVAFVLLEIRMKDEALIPMRLFRSSPFSFSIAIRLLVGLAMFGAMSMLPQFLQIVRGASPTKAGLMLLPFMLGVMVFAAISGQVTSRTGHYKMFPIMGSALMVTASLLFYFKLSPEMPLWETDLYMVIFGAGLGLNMQTLQIAAQNAVPAKDMGVATATATSAQQLGGTLGTAVFVSMLFSLVGDKIKDAFVTDKNSLIAAAQDPNVLHNPANKPILQALQSGGGGGASSSGVLQDSSFLQQIDPRLAHPFFLGFSNTMQIVFLCAAAIAGLACIFGFFMKELPLRTMSGLQAAHAEQAEAARAAGAGAADGAADGAGTGELADGHPDAVTQVLPVTRNGTSHNGHGAAAALFDGAIADGAVVAGAGHGGAGHSGAGLGGSIDGGRHALADTNVQPVPALVAHGEPIGTHAGTAAPAASSVANALATGSPLGKTPQTQGGQGISRDRVHGVVRTADRGVVANAVLTLIDSDGRQVDRVLAGDDGKYAMGAPGNGAYVLIASAPAHQPQASPVMVGPAPVSMDIVLTGTSGLLGRVTAAGSGAAGKPATPVVGATATLADGRGEVVGARQTDDAGEYAFTELVAGDYTLVVNADRYRPAALPVSIAGGDRKRQDVELVSGATLSGVAIAAATERPVVDARITLLDSAGNVVGVTNTDDSGGYHFGDLAEGEYTVIASGYPPVASTLRVAGGELGEHHVRFDHPDI